ncbi:hypothetical protein [Hyphomicrobium sp. LHD-15]|uniref:hypothetical protein n=1 Tax=Hyphomicrobium sp. LHD-15 TaxID=3072142 RepID=UPI0028101301|nr:hypothetical protein [Hyphomicrobium sp. LHD-15]MDQ8700114.1 hypothetical protein [Hyphomicrobium sp. LHD-15]
MTLRRFALALTPAVRTTAVLGLLACVGLGVATANTEAVVARHFTQALAATPQQTVALNASGPLVSGSEAYWLSEKRRHELQHDAQGAALEPAAWSVPLTGGLSVGDRITISSGKSERVLQVIAVADVEPTPGQPATSEANSAPRHIAVTCRDLSTSDGRLVTFLTPTTPASSAKFRAL